MVAMVCPADVVLSRQLRQALGVYDYLLKPLNILAGIGPAIEKRLAARGISCIGDLLLHLPKRHVDDRHAVSIGELQPNVPVRVHGTVVSLEKRGRPGRQHVLVTLADDEGDLLQLRFFHSAYLLRDARMKPDSRISVRGTPEFRGGKWQMVHPEWQVLERYHPGWRARYASIAGIAGTRMAAFIEKALHTLPTGATSPLDGCLQDYPDLRQSLVHVHHPPEQGPESQAIRRAYERLQLEELLTYLHLMQQKRRMAQVSAPAMREMRLAEELLGRLPYSLTDAQARAWEEIHHDLASGQRMHRLLQGDVGAGKTWVAALAMLVAKDNGYQSALLALTEVLAAQHAETLNGLLAKLGMQVEMLTGGLSSAQKKHIHAGLAEGSIPLVVGTHALISEDVRFSRLGLAVVDEQHRFGVRQRWELAERGEGVHLLAMTATPIPRSLALALYGDMDLSLMQGMPPGRKPVQTTVIDHGRRAKLADGMHRILQQDGRIYWIVPRIDDDEDGASVQQRSEALACRFPDAGVLGLHGRLKSQEKKAALDRFTQGGCRLLVSTTVVEVGVNVPAARLIIIEQAERYGLAQLHQLRGRVGRSSEQGYCVLLPSPEASAAALSRLSHMARIHDGLELAELDLKLRGAGDVLGARQSGEAGFRLVDVAGDAGLIRHWHGHLPDVTPTDAMIRFWRNMALSVD